MSVQSSRSQTLHGSVGYGGRILREGNSWGGEPALFTFLSLLARVLLCYCYRQYLITAERATWTGVLTDIGNTTRLQCPGTMFQHQATVSCPSESTLNPGVINTGCSAGKGPSGAGQCGILSYLAYCVDRPTCRSFSVIYLSPNLNSVQVTAQSLREEIWLNKFIPKVFFTNSSQQGSWELVCLPMESRNYELHSQDPSHPTFLYMYYRIFGTVCTRSLD
jgi:hypothetical protein